MLLFCFFLLLLLCAFINLLQFGFQWNLQFYPPIFVLVGWLLLMANLEVCLGPWPCHFGINSAHKPSCSWISCTHWQMHPLNEAAAFLESLLGLLGEIHGMSPSKHCQGDRKSLNSNSPFTAPFLQTPCPNMYPDRSEKKNFSLPQNPFPRKDGGKRTHTSASYLHSTL